MDLSGQTIGHYLVGAKLGAGGMGVVYRARDTKLGRDVALKVLPAETSGDPAAHAQLLQEARLASVLNHPNICTVYEIGEDRDIAFAAMEFVEGRPLRAAVPMEGLPLELLIRYGAQIADAVSYAHEHGVIHRDIKTRNVMVTPQGRVKVLDFGLARRLTSEAEQMTRSEVSPGHTPVAGTLHYLAPELLRGENADARSDIWALGVTLYEMAAGGLPFDAPTGYELSSKILRDPLPPLPAGLPSGVRAIILRCLAKEPGQRYQHAGEIRAALEAISTDAMRNASPGEEGPSPRRFSARVLMLVILSIAAAGSIAVWKSFSPKTEAPASAGPRLSNGGRPSANSEANEYYEKSLAILLASQRDLPRARQMMDRALELDPKFAEARAWRAFMIFLVLDATQSTDTRLLYEVEAEARQALEDDPNCIQAHTTLAAVYQMQGHRELARAEAEKTLALKPNDPDATVWLVQYHWDMGDTQTALDLVTRSLQSNPLFWPLRMNRGELLRQLGQYAEAQREQEKVLEQDPYSFYAIRNLARIHMDAGNRAEARRVLERARPEDRGNYSLRITEAILNAMEGKRREALRGMTPEMLKAIEGSVVSEREAAQLYAVLGETEKALHWLDQSFRHGDENLEWLQRDPLLSNVRGHPRFKQILETIAFRRHQREKKSP